MKKSLSFLHKTFPISVSNITENILFFSFGHKTTKKHFLETNFNFLPRKPHKIGSYSLQYAHVCRTCVPYLVILKSSNRIFCKIGNWLHVF